MENENRSFGFGTENQQEGTPAEGYGEPQGGEMNGSQSYGDASQQYGNQSYGDANQQYGSQSYGDVNQQYGQSYGAPNQQYGNQSYGDANQQYGQSYGAPNQQYGSQSYGDPNQSYGSQSYGAPNQSYGNQSYGDANQQYGQSFGQPDYAMGAVPFDKNGQPLKNRFGMKMTFSILEILCCCGCNLLTMVMGIIGCVFTTKSNTAYKEGRWEEFKTNAKSASICLWIGFGIAVIYLIASIYSWTAGGLGEEFMEGFWEGYYGATSNDNSDKNDYNIDKFLNDKDDSGKSTETESTELTGTESAGNEDAAKPSEPLNVTPGEGFTDPVITINGAAVTLPLSYSDLKEMGFYIEGEDEEYIANGNEYYYPDVYDSNGNELGYVYVGNLTDAPIALKEGVVFGFWLSSTAIENGELSFSFANGLTENAAKEDFLSAFGEPDYSYESEDSDYQTYDWYNHNPNYYDSSDNSLSVSFWEGKLTDLTIKYRGWE